MAVFHHHSKNDEFQSLLKISFIVIEIIIFKNDEIQSQPNVHQRHK